VSKTAVRSGLIVGATFVWLAAPRAWADSKTGDAPRAVDARVSSFVPGSRHSFFPVSLEAYPRTDEARAADSAGPGEFTLRESVGRFVMAPPAGQDLSSLVTEEGKGKSTSYLPVLYSLLIPGTGEIALGHYVRGSLLLGAEITAWTGYIYYHNEGLDSRQAYESFADAHWSYDKWIFDHLAMQDYPDDERTFELLDSIGRTEWDQWPGYHTYHPKETEKQNYYENLGKYDWFISGWEDWDPITAAMDTDLRDTYRAMRRESNDQLDKAQDFIYLSIAARVCSLVDTYFLVRKQNAEMSGALSKPGFSLDAHATGFASGQVALVYHFR
jgi:hypothetical protein